MLKLLERAVTSSHDRLILLAPDTPSSGSFRFVENNETLHTRILREMQRLRGSVYLEDGAVTRAQLSCDGLHETVEDNRSWHLIMLDNDRRVSGCAWYMEHADSVGVHELRAWHSPLASSQWRRSLRAAMESEFRRARQASLRFVEVGGWAIGERSRCTSDGLVLALAGYSLGQARGGCLGMTTATVRHCSSSILRRIGGSSLEAGGTTVPSYYDPKYRCEMEVLRFDSRQPSSKYAALIDILREKLTEVLVIAKPGAPIAPPAHAAVPVYAASPRGDQYVHAGRWVAA
jgi:hypothetical protein